MITWFEKHHKISTVITIIIAIVIYYVSTLQGGGSGTGGKAWLPTAYHILAFFFLNAFTMLSVIRGKHKEYLLPTTIIVLIYGILDEFHQLFVPGRHFSILDIALDSLGTLLALLLYNTMLWARKK